MPATRCPCPSQVSSGLSLRALPSFTSQDGVSGGDAVDSLAPAPQPGAAKQSLALSPWPEPPRPPSELQSADHSQVPAPGRSLCGSQAGSTTDTAQVQGCSLGTDRSLDAHVSTWAGPAPPSPLSGPGPPRTITVAMMDSSASLKLSMRCECWIPSATSSSGEPTEVSPCPSRVGSGVWGLDMMEPGKKHRSEPERYSRGRCLRGVCWVLHQVNFTGNCQTIYGVAAGLHAHQQGASYNCSPQGLQALYKFDDFSILAIEITEMLFHHDSTCTSY